MLACIMYIVFLSLFFFSLFLFPVFSLIRFFSSLILLFSFRSEDNGIENNPILKTTISNCQDVNVWGYKTRKQLSVCVERYTNMILLHVMVISRFFVFVLLSFFLFLFIFFSFFFFFFLSFFFFRVRSEDHEIENNPVLKQPKMTACRL